jgi:hypothetical protein
VYLELIYSEVSALCYQPEGVSLQKISFACPPAGFLSATNPSMHESAKITKS